MRLVGRIVPAPRLVVSVASAVSSLWGDLAEPDGTVLAVPPRPAGTRDGGRHHAGARRHMFSRSGLARAAASRRECVSARARRPAAAKRWERPRLRRSGDDDRRSSGSAGDARKLHPLICRLRVAI